MLDVNYADRARQDEFHCLTISVVSAVSFALVTWVKMLIQSLLTLWREIQTTFNGVLGAEQG